ncbi:MAG TPA: glycosyltransferase family 2 protein [Desulfomonilaceae bacterium]|nr:glycosyltransferase family 2 protein [Desulfomonilaceae bacterium]
MNEPPDSARVAVLVLNLNGAHFLDDCFRALLSIQHPLMDIYLVDNHSNDNSLELTRTHYPTIRIIQHDTNLGFGGAYDRVIRQLDHDYVVLLNNDTVVDEGWLDALLRVAERDVRIAACGSKIVMKWDPDVIDHAGGMLTMIGSGLDRGKWSKDRGQYDQSGEVGFACGCSLLIKRDAYLKAGGFDPDYLAYHEDVDLCWRLRLLGYSIMYVPDSIVHHHMGGGETPTIGTPFKTYLCQKNRLANVIRNMGVPRLLSAFPVSVTYDAVRTIQFLVQGQGDLLASLFRGYLDTFKNFGKLWRQRSIVQKSRVVSEKDLGRFFVPVIDSVRAYFLSSKYSRQEIRDSNSPLSKETSS